MILNSILKLFWVFYLFGYSKADVTNEPQCFITGICSGNVATTTPLNTKEACLAECKLDPRCNWFTFISSTSACLHFTFCSTLDTSCSACISGERACDKDPKGNVVLVVGGDGSFDVELYSPEPGCHSVLKSVPGQMYEFWRPVLAYIGEKILACGGGGGENNMKCWSYDANIDNWNEITKSSDTHNHMSGVAYQGKLYILDENYARIYDPNSNTWNTWPKPDFSGKDLCFLTWKDDFLLMGGHEDYVQKYNTKSKTWTLVSSSIPLTIHNSACVVLPNYNILVVGSENLADYYSAAIYNVTANTWTKLNRTAHIKEGSSLVSLSNRIFSIGGLSDHIEEFHPSNNSWTPVSRKLFIARTQHSSISVPASMFPNIYLGCQGIN